MRSHKIRGSGDENGLLREINDQLLSQRLALLFYPAPSLNIEHVVCTVTSHLFHKLAIWQVK